MNRDEIDMETSEWYGDNPISLEDLKNLIPQLQKKYGKRAIVRFDAGYNNVSVMVKPTKKVKNVRN